MAQTWSIGGQSASSLKARNLQLHLASLATGTAQFQIPSRTLTTAAEFAEGQVLSLSRGGETLFKGTLLPIEYVYSGRAYYIRYRLADAWWQLERLVYQQRWATGSWVNNEWTPSTVWKSKVILGQSPDGARLTNAEVIRDVVEFARDHGVDIAPGTIGAGVQFPFDEVEDLTCAEVIRRVSRYTPDATTSIDYGSNRFNWHRRANMAAITVSVSHDDVYSWTLRKRDDLKVPAVVIKYEQQRSVDGNEWIETSVDSAPQGATGMTPGAIVQTCQLAGFSVSTMVQAQNLVVAPLEFNTLASWTARLPEFAADIAAGRIVDVTFAQVSRTGVLPNELIEGTIQDWMRFGRPGAVYALADESTDLTATIYYIRMDPANPDAPGVRVENEVLRCRVTTTNGETRQYRRSTRSGDVLVESPPEGLAAAFLAAMNDAHWAGSLVVKASGYTVETARRLSISGGPAGFSGMGAIVQSVDIDADTDKATIMVGPPQHLSPQDVIELLRANRLRTPAVSAGIRVSGYNTGGGGTIEIGSAHPKHDSSRSGGLLGEFTEVLTDIRVTSTAVEKKTQSVRILAAREESEWTAVEGGEISPCDEGA